MDSRAAGQGTGDEAEEEELGGAGRLQTLCLSKRSDGVWIDGWDLQSVV